MHRRDFLKATITASALAGLEASSLAQAARRAVYLTIETAAGKLRGIDIDGIKQFRGIPYGAPTGGSNRFMPPKPVVPWAGIRDAYGYGEISPQPFSSPTHAFGNLIDFDLHVGDMGDDCLNLNIWTPGVADGANKPVLVYYHGGGLSTGSGNHDLYNGDRLARYADVVVVTVNHRLSAFGYINLTDVGAPAEFADSGNVGFLDLAQSLEWIRDNIAAFGGDPHAVTIFGQSGGGTKVGALMAMDRPKGLFHRAGIQSGYLSLASRETSAASAKTLLAALGVGTDWRKLQQLTPEAIVEAQVAIGTYDWLSGKPVTRPSPQFQAVLDGRIMHSEIRDLAAVRKSAHVPLLIGYELDDAGWPMTNFDITEQGLTDVAAQLAGSPRADEIVKLYLERYPNKTPFIIQAAMMTDEHLLTVVSDLAERRAQLGAKTWVYRFDWPSQALEGRFGATHGMEMSLVFHNTHQPTVGGETAVSQTMADRMASIFAGLARRGDPNNSLVPDWPVYSRERRETMVINHPYDRVIDDPNAQFRRLWAEVHAEKKKPVAN